MRRRVINEEKSALIRRLYRYIVSQDVLPGLYLIRVFQSYKFRQASDFWYLTGFEEPDAAVILEKTSSSRGYRMTLFCHGSDPEQAQWDGAK